MVSFRHMFLRMKTFALRIADNIAQMTSVVERLHRRSNEGRWMDRVRKTATRMTALHVNDNKANKVSRGRTTKFVTSRKMCCACSVRPLTRHCWFGNLAAEEVWLKSEAPGCNKTIINAPVIFLGRRSRCYSLWQRTQHFFLVKLIASSDKYTCPVDEISTNH